MPYPAGHRIRTRGKIIKSARRLFNRHGFDNVTVQQIMAGAGLTHGGFYSYFQSKDELYIQVLGCFLSDSNWGTMWEGVEVDGSAADVAAQIVRAYLSSQHFEDIENSCPMVALSTDVTRGCDKAKLAFENVFAAMVSILERSATEGNKYRRERAQAMAAMCVGGMVVARAMANRVAADELRGACMATALDLGGWVDTSAQKNRAH